MKKKNKKVLKFLSGVGLIAWGFIPDPTDVTIVIPIALIGGGLALINDALK